MPAQPVTMLIVRPYYAPATAFVDQRARTHLHLSIAVGADYARADELRRSLRARFRDACVLDVHGIPQYHLHAQVNDLRSWKRVQRAAERAGLRIEYATTRDHHAVEEIVAEWASPDDQTTGTRR